MIIWMKTQIKCQHPALRLHERSAWVTVAWRTQPASLASCLEPPRPILLGTPACFSLPSPRSPMLQLYHPQRSGCCHPIPSLSHHPDTFLPSASPSLLNGSSPTLLGFPGSASDKKTPLPVQETEDTGSIPGAGRSPGEGNGNPLQCPCLESPVDRGTWRAAVHGVAKSRTRLK